MVLSKDLKKLLVSGIALVTLATTGSGVVSAQTTANASSRTAKITRLEHRKSHDYKDIKLVNRELSKLMPRRTRRHLHKHHESVAVWYWHNSHRLYKKYINTSNMFRKGYDDGSNGNGSVLDMDYSKNKMYYQGWIIGAGSNAYNSGKQSFINALSQYKQGLIYAHNNNAEDITLDGDNRWEANDD